VTAADKAAAAAKIARFFIAFISSGEMFTRNPDLCYGRIV
jgi:hypothetical protein